MVDELFFNEKFEGFKFICFKNSGAEFAYIIDIQREINAIESSNNC